MNNIYNYIKQHKWAAIFFFAAWLLIAAYGFVHLRFEEDITKVLPQNDKTTLTAKVLKQLNFADKVSVIVSTEKGGSTADMLSVGEQLRDTLSTFTNYITGIQGVVADDEIEATWEFVYEHLPLFLEEQDYAYIEGRIAADSLQAMVQSQYRTLLTPAGMVAQQYIRKDPLGLTFRGLQKLQTLNAAADLKLQNGFLTTTNGQHILFFLNPKYEGNDSGHNAEFVQILNQLQDTINAQNEGKVRTYFFGAPFVSVSNASQIKTDIISTVFISLTVLCLLLMFFYRSVYVPFIAFIPSVFGVLTALAVLYVLKGSISAISVSMGAVLLGVTIDYSLHILTHYKVVHNTKELYKAVTLPILLSSVTTAISFLCLLFVHSEVMRDLGIFASVGIMVSAGLSLVLVPHFYRSNKKVVVRKTFLDRVGAYPFHQNKWVVAVCLGLIGVSFFFFQKVKFNGDIAAINYMNERAKTAQLQLEAITDSGYQSVYAAAYGNTLDEALQHNYQLYQALQHYEATDSIRHFSSVARVVLPQSEQQRRIDQWQRFWAEHQSSLEKQLQEYGAAVGFKERTYAPFFELLNEDFGVINLTTYKELSALPIDDFISEKDGFYTIANLVKLRAEEREAFIASAEKNTPTIVIDRKHLNETFLGKLKDDILLLVNYSSVAIFLILLFFFRRIELALLALVPIAITGVVTAALMYFLGIEFNVFSMIVCTLVLGHSVDFSIFMTCALQRQYTNGRNELPVYKTSVLLASITTFLAIGTMVFAKHPALKSIAAVSVLGIFTALVITFVFYPTLFGFFIGSRPKKGLSPVSLRLLLHSVVLLLYYGISSVILSNIGWLIVKLRPKSSLGVRRVAAWLTQSVLYLNPFVRKRVENPANEHLARAQVVIANHSSWLDTLAMSMYTYKLSYMVNDWVYNSVVFGRYVRAMGFFLASNGIEKGLSLFGKNIEEGVSVMIFPEGKRSESNEVQRFHKGAFVIADAFKVAILPVYIHGTAEVQPKGDFIIYDGAITVVVGEPIEADEMRYGSSPRERAKAIGAAYREKFLALRKRLEGVDYLKKKLFLNYLYKDAEVVRGVKADYQKHRQAYWELVHSLPEKAKIVREGDDYGALDFLLLYTYPQREVVAVIADDEKRAVAEQSYLIKIRKLQYVKELPERDWEEWIFVRR